MHDTVVIGEGVALDARPAAFVTRMLASLLDIVVLLLVIAVFSTIAVSITDPFSPGNAQIINTLLMATVMVGVPTAVETLSRGSSLGKVAAGIRVVRDDGGPIRFRHAFVRALVGIGELWMTVGCVAVIASLCNDRGKRLGDIAAGTYTIRVRGGATHFSPIAMPPYLAQWAHFAEMRALPDGLALSVRQFLDRCHSLHDGSRARMGQELAARVESYVAPGPPPETAAEAFLAAVLVERSRREWHVAQRTKRLTSAQAVLVRTLPYSIPDPRR